MSKLFNVAENNITYHLQNIFKTGKLEENPTTQKIRVVQNEGTRKVSKKSVIRRNEKGFKSIYRTMEKLKTNLKRSNNYARFRKNYWKYDRQAKHLLYKFD